MTYPTRRFAELTWPEVADAIGRGAGIVLPVGATEQHGHHLPLATDTLLAGDLADALGEPLDLLVAPPLSYGYRSRPLSGGGQGFVGTSSLSARALMAQVHDLLREFVRQGFRRIVVLNWHFENAHFLYEAVFTALEPHSETPATAMVMEAPFQDLSEETMRLLFGDEFPGWATEHASIMETSLMLHLHPELVRFERAVDDRAQRSPWWDVIPTPDALVPASGTLWKATRADPEKGRRTWDEIVAGARAAVEQELPPP